MDRNTLIGIGLIFVLFVVWQQVTGPTQEQIEAQQREQDSIEQAMLLADSLERLATTKVTGETTPVAPAAIPDSLVRQQLVGAFGPFAPAAAGEDKTWVLENNLSRITIASKGGRIKEVLLKEHYKVVKEDSSREDTKIPLKLLADDKNKFEYFLPVANLPSGGVSTADLYFEAVEVSDASLTLRAQLGEGQYIQQRYAIEQESYKVDYQIDFTGINNLLAAQDQLQLTWINYLDRIEKNTRIEKMNSTLYYKKQGESPSNCSFTGNDEETSKGNPVKWIAFSNQFFNTSLIAEEDFLEGEFAAETLDEDSEDLKRMAAQIAVPFNRSAAQNSFAMTIYSGPNEFERLYAMDLSLEDVIPYGWNIFGTINRWVIRPLFNWLSNFFASKGIVILVLTLIVKLALYPLTYRMLHSQSKMSALKPEIEKMKARFKDDSQKIQMETMKLYREFGVNPLGSCLPMLMQLPIWFALYRFFPAAIDFRQEGFLWANDLSSYDEFFQLPFTIPLGIGSHISLFTVLWAITTLMYTYYNSRHMDFSAQPAMKYMQYLMPLFFLGFFNSYASGLTAYLLFSNLINIAQTLITKGYIIDQKKIKADMDAYRAKPKKKKKSGFQERLQKALEEQRKIQEQQQAARAKKKKK